MVVTTVGCIFLIYVLVVVWARRKDIQDDAKVSLQLIMIPKSLFAQSILTEFFSQPYSLPFA